MPGLSEESVEFAASGVEGSLLVFPAVVYQWAAVLVDHIADQLFRSDFSQRRVFVQVADDLVLRIVGLGEAAEEGSESARGRRRKSPTSAP